MADMECRHKNEKGFDQRKIKYCQMFKSLRDG